jgi:hypothetical protein
MNDYRLQLPDEAAWWVAADACGWAKYEYEPQVIEFDQEPPEPIVKNKWLDTSERDFDIIGTIYKPTGNTIEQEGIEIQEMTAINGYHVNIRLHNTELPESMAQYVVIPNNPVRTWAGTSI